MTDKPTIDALLAHLGPSGSIPGTHPPKPDAGADRVLSELAQAAPEMAPPPDLFDKIDAALDAKPASIVTKRADEGTWHEVWPGIWMKRLSREPDGRQVCLLRCLPGSTIPGHRHDHDETVYVLEGEFQMAGLTVRAGDSQFAIGGTDHPDVHTSTGCLLLVCG